MILSKAVYQTKHQRRMCMETDFLKRDVQALKKKNFVRLGIASNYGLDENGCREALETCRYVFWNPRAKTMTVPLREAIKRSRESYVIAGGPTVSVLHGQLSRYVDRVRTLLQSDYIDVLQLYWLGTTSHLSRSMQDELVRLRESGSIRAAGVSIHNRTRAGRLAADSILDLFMIRYNAAHPGAERDIFPHLAKRHPAIVAYTATSWRKLLKQPKGWSGPAMSAGDCYRFCLNSPHVDVVMTAPKSIQEFRDNLRELEKGPLSAEEEAWMREFGRCVHG
jgi:aryl-alcohol dehydrogenase-like predicted oxidoreductase